VGKEKSRAKREALGENVSPEEFLTVKPVLAPDWVQKTFAFFWPISEQQISESISCVLTQSTRGSFVPYFALLVHQTFKALFIENLTVNAHSSAEAYSRTLGKKTRGARRLGRGKIKAHGERPSFPALPFSLSSAPASRFFLWCLLT